MSDTLVLNKNYYAIHIMDWQRAISLLYQGHADALERALWVALRKLNEQYRIHENLARDHADAGMKKRLNESASSAKHDMEKLEEIISRL